jgi:hypothetical protein
MTLYGFSELLLIAPAAGDAALMPPVLMPPACLCPHPSVCVFVTSDCTEEVTGLGACRDTAVLVAIYNNETDIKAHGSSCS